MIFILKLSKYFSFLGIKKVHHTKAAFPTWA